MSHKLSILYSWLVKTCTYFLPNHPIFMRFRGFLYSLMMRKCGRNFQVASTVTLNSLRELEVGKNVYIAHNTVLIGKRILIGDDVIVGPNCVISSANHTYDGISFRNSKSVQGIVKLEDGSWVA